MNRGPLIKMLAQIISEFLLRAAANSNNDVPRPSIMDLLYQISILNDGTVKWRQIKIVIRKGEPIFS
jgi:hypothetical protein